MKNPTWCNGKDILFNLDIDSFNNLVKGVQFQNLSLYRGVFLMSNFFEFLRLRKSFIKSSLEAKEIRHNFKLIK